MNIKIKNNSTVYIRVFSNKKGGYPKGSRFSLTLTIGKREIQTLLLLDKTRKFVSPLVYTEKILFKEATSPTEEVATQAYIKNIDTDEIIELNNYFKKNSKKSTIYTFTDNGKEAPTWLLELSYWSGTIPIVGEPNRDYVLFMKDREEYNIMQIEGVTGVDVKYASSKIISEIIVFNSAKNKNPNITNEIPKYLENIPVSLEEADFFLQMPTLPAISSMKIHEKHDDEFGTSGLFVKYRNRGYWLSAAHVLFRNSDLIANINNSITYYQGVSIYNDNIPIYVDNEIIGNARRGYYGAVLNCHLSEPYIYLDCGIVEVNKNSFTVSTNSYSVAASRDEIVKNFLNSRVNKNGAESGITEGVLLSDSLTMLVTDAIQGTPYEFKNQLKIRGIQTDFSKEGDSGSIVIHKNTQKVIGLVIAGTNWGSSDSYTTATPIYNIFKFLNLVVP